MLLDQSGMLDPDFAAAAFKLEKPGEFTKPVHSQFGYHIIKLLKQDPKGYMPLDKVKGEIHDFLVDKTVSEEIQAMLKAERAKSNVKVYDFTPAKVDTKTTKNPGAAPTPVL
jgi:parvulin-like peptidyl-prolyl isomerase